MLLEDEAPWVLTGAPIFPPMEPVLFDILQGAGEQVLYGPGPLRGRLLQLAPGASYRLCTAGVQLREEINHRYPRRDTASDGWLGDAAHRQRRSDHNPNGAGVVRALDVDKDGIPAGSIVELVRKMGKAGDRRLVGGYLIWQAQIAGTHTGWNWHKYTGTNPHTQHFHVSFADQSSDYDRRGSWGIKSPTPKPDRWLGLANPPMVGQDVLNVQRALNKAGNSIPEDGVYGRITADLVALFQRNRGIKERGVGPLTWAALRRVAHG